MSRRLLVALLLPAIIAGRVAAVEETAGVLLHRPAESTMDLRNRYFIDLLQLAIDHTVADYGLLTLKPADIPVSQERSFHLVRNGIYMDIVWGMTDSERERELAPVRIPLLKGLLGCRVAIVRRDRLAEFSRINTIEDLQDYTIIQGTGWPDVDILKASGLNVITSPDYDGMFAMINGGRADLFFRGITEAWVEIGSVGFADLAVDTNLLLSYPGPIYFFVNRAREDLVERLTTGLQRAIENGRFDAVINHHPYIIEARTELARHERRVFPLQNPQLPAETPLADPALWMELEVGSKRLRCIDSR